MAFRVDMSPLERSSIGMANTLTGLGSTLGNRMREGQSQDQQAQLNQAVNSALNGDEQALEMVGMQNPELAMKIRDRKAALNSVLSSEMANKTADVWSIMLNSPQEQQEALFNQYVDDPSLDIDEEDRGLLSTPNVVKGLIGKIKGKDYMEQVFGGETSPEKRANIEIKQQELELKKQEAATKALERKDQIKLKKIEAEEKALDRKLQRETNELKKQELTIKVEDKKKEKEALQRKAKVEGEQAVSEIDGAISVASEVANHPGLDAAVGGTSFFPTVPGSEASNFEAKLEQFKSKQFLTGIEKMKGMGALSENEGKKIAAAAGALELGMSEEAFRKEMEIIMSGLQKAKGFLHEKYGVPIQDTESAPVERERVTAPDMTGQGRNRDEIFSQYGL